MSRVLTALTGLLFVLAILAVGFWYLALAPAEGPPARVHLGSLEEPVEVRQLDGPAPRLRAESRPDACAGLGYVHGYRRGWTALLLRQVALGRLGRWFDPAAGAFDRWARMLGFAATAREAYRRASPAERRRLQAYADGMRAALADRADRMDELLLLRADPIPWEPWHTLAVRNLVAWLGTPPLELPDTPAPPPDTTISASTDTAAALPSDSTVALRADSTVAPRADSTVRTLPDTVAARWLAVDRRLRSWLGLRGFNHGRAWAEVSADPPLLVQQHVYGRSARVPFLPVIVRRDDRSAELLTVPGTTLWPGGRSGSRAWSVFLTSDAALERVPAEAEPPAPSHETIRFRDGTQEVVSFRRSRAHLHLSPRWRIAWSGFDPVGESAGWMRLWSADADGGSFAPFSGEGLTVDRAGTVATLGAPDEQVQWPEGRFVGNGRWAARSIGRVSDVLTQEGRPEPRAVFEDRYSPWSDSVSSRLVRVVGPEVLRPGPVQEAFTYLRNWDGSYASASIGASIFDTWLAAFRSRRGRLPAVGAVDTAEARISWYRALEGAADSLARRFGRDPSLWRWEQVQPNRRIFPAFSDSTYLPDRLHSIVSGRYAPLEPSGFGHPTALNWGGSSVLGPRSAPATWTYAIGGTSWNRSLHRGRPARVDRFLGRYLTGERYGRVFEVLLTAKVRSENASSAATRLIPDSP